MPAHNSTKNQEQAVSGGWDTSVDVAQTIVGNVAITGDETVSGTLGVTGVATFATSLVGKNHSFHPTTGIEAITAAGTNQATAEVFASTTAGYKLVSDGDGTKGVSFSLIASYPQGRVFTVENAASSALKVYPGTGETINGGSANAAVTIPARAVVTFTVSSATNWSADFITPATTFTQTDSTADATIAAPTATTLTHSAVGGTADGTLVDCTGTYSEAAVEENFKECATSINLLIADVRDNKSAINSIIDALQARGIVL